MSKTATKKLNLKEKLDEDSLDLSLCNLSKVPVKEISEFPKVKKLNLSFNQLTSLSNDFSKLVNIRELDLSKNQLQLLPDNFGQLINLKNLDLLGNNLTSLPTSFSELKNLQWLDLKDNPLNPELRKAAGECGDEAQCKKCALNVVKYMKQVAADEERKRQIELKKRKEEQVRKEAEEKEKENLLKLQKKQEREQRRLINEQKRKEIFEKQVENKEKSFTEQSDIAKKQQSKSTKRGCLSLFSFMSFFLIISVILIGTYVILVDYCDSQSIVFKNFKKFSNNQSLNIIFQYVDKNVCPTVNLNKIPFQNYLKMIQQIYH